MPCAATIFAAGFNAHGQLHPWSRPINICSFKPIASLEVFEPSFGTAIPCALWSSTIIAANNSNNLIHLGLSGEGHKEVILSNVHRHVHFFGDVGGVKGYLTEKGEIYVLQHDGAFKHCAPIRGEHFISPDRDTIINLAIAGNEKVCVVTQPSMTHDRDGPSSRHTIHVFNSLTSFMSGSPPLSSSPFLDGWVRSIYASATSFTILATPFPDRFITADVFTFGDARYPTLLGRTPSTERPASVPTRVPKLDGTTLRKVVAGSRLVAALDVDGDLYVWGHTLPQPIQRDHSGLGQLLNATNDFGKVEEVHSVYDIDGCETKIADVAVGDEHIVALTEKGEVWGFGSNEYGQLSLEQDAKGTEGKWLKCFNDAQKEGEVVEMAAAPFATFLVVKQNQEEGSTKGKKRARES
ncbi:MAG: hypothetical protein Q9201_003725 [Fulgogasparrea decipioides]